MRCRKCGCTHHNGSRYATTPNGIECLEYECARCGFKWTWRTREQEAEVVAFILRGELDV